MSYTSSYPVHRSNPSQALNDIEANMDEDAYRMLIEGGETVL